MQIPNPFQHDENLRPWFELDREYQDFTRQTLRRYLLNQKPQTNQLMTTKPNFRQLFANLTHNVVAASVAGLLILTAISASAAQLVAPEEYKPSTLVKNLFSANKQTDID